MWTDCLTGATPLPETYLPMIDLPIDSVLEDLAARLASATAAVLEAPPGAGKTTRVPLSLVDQAWLAGKRIIMLEPRRLAARMAARFMAASLGEQPGETVGYRTRQDTRIGPKTRIEVVTEGVLTRMVQSEPDLPGVGLLIFDEFHERSLQGDVGLALALDVQRALRDDLKLLVMSATLDGDRVSALLGGVPVVRSEGRVFPVETRYRPDLAQKDVAAAVAAACRMACQETEGSLLAFLPGEGEIRRTEARLKAANLGAGVMIAPLYGALTKEAQNAAVQAAPPGTRKIVLATSIAETSLTIDGIRVVIDGGLARKPQFDPRTAMGRLRTIRVSRAAAEQRQGRAGRTAPGICYRLWAEAEQKGLTPFDSPEILQADLAPLALELARWGAPPESLVWMDAPPQAAFAQAQTLLRDLDALDGENRLTRHGKAMAALPLHPRLAHMVLKGQQAGAGGTACDLAALLEERDILSLSWDERDADVTRRLDALHKGAPAALVNKGALHRVRDAAKRLRRHIEAKGEDETQAGLLLAYAYPDRIAQKRPGDDGRFVLANGRGVRVDPVDRLSREPWIVVAAQGGRDREDTVFLAAAIDRDSLADAFKDHLVSQSDVAWDARQEAVAARRRTTLGALVLDEGPLDEDTSEAVMAAMLDGIRQMGIDCLPWTEELKAWRARVALLRSLDPDDWPDVSDDGLLDSMETWLVPYLDGVTRRAHLTRIALSDALTGLLDWKAQQRLDREAPTHMTVPSGSNYRLDYVGDAPVLAVKLQEMFGATETPTVVGGRVAVVIHLLSPAGRPLQVTQDLAGFWRGSYAAVKADMKGRYPKHPWPDDPMTAPPTRRTKRKGD